jgi:hypothetical protein
MLEPARYPWRERGDRRALEGKHEVGGPYPRADEDEAGQGDGVFEGPTAEEDLGG